MSHDTPAPPGTGDNSTDGPVWTAPPNEGSGPAGTGSGTGTTVVPFRRPDTPADPDTVDGEVIEDGRWIERSEARQTWGTRVLHGTGRVLAGPSDETRARLAIATVDAAHATGSRVRSGARALKRGGRVLHRHASIIGAGIEAARQRRRADHDHTDLKAARAAANERGDAAAVEALTRQHNESRHVGVDAATKKFALAWSILWRGSAALAVLFVVSVIVGGINGFGRWLGVFNANDVLAVWRDALTIVYTIAVVIVTWWWAIPTGWMLLKLSRWWRDGNRLGEQVLPVHLRKQAVGNLRVELSESAIVAALANIGNSKLNSVIKAGWPNRDSENPWVQPPMVDGKGWSTKIRLPQGAPVSQVAKAKEMLAHNLACRPIELFIRPDSEDPTVMDLFRLNHGVLREPVDPYPLLHDGATDYWNGGFPAGVNLRGEPITATIPERNFVFAGSPGSGKSTLMITLTAGAILDPLVDVDVFVFAENNDYEAFAPCLNTYSAGVEPEKVDAALEHLQALYDDLTVRGRLLQKHNVNSVQEAGRAIVAKEPGLRPRIVVLEECQKLFRQDKPEDRRKVVNLVVNLFMAARKYAVHLAFLTPSPSDQSLPRDLIAVTTNKACGAIGDKTRNNVVLGEKAHENGISALGLKPRTETALNDCGTLIAVGFMDEPGALRSYHLTSEQREQIAARAAEARGATTVTEIEVVRDPLADIHTVIADITPREGEQHPRAAAIAAALSARWNHYSKWKSKQVLDVLDGANYKVPTTDRIFPVDPARVADALAARDTLPVE
ncbi:ATP-binding protein [Amycolatopsis japonica]|uniref:ATP-binding protein n=1 Tax=Amycolatopsis japonica TaxID=208439 RepID=UPI00366EEC9D